MSTSWTCTPWWSSSTTARSTCTRSPCSPSLRPPKCCASLDSRSSRQRTHTAWVLAMGQQSPQYEPLYIANSPSARSIWLRYRTWPIPAAARRSTRTPNRSHIRTMARYTTTAAPRPSSAARERVRHRRRRCHRCPRTSTTSCWSAWPWCTAAVPPPPPRRPPTPLSVCAARTTACRCPAPLAVAATTTAPTCRRFMRAAPRPSRLRPTSVRSSTTTTTTRRRWRRRSVSVPVETGFRIGIGEPKGTKHFHSISRTVRQRTHRQRKLWQRQWQWQRSEQRQRNLHQRQAGQPHTFAAGSSGRRWCQVGAHGHGLL